MGKNNSHITLEKRNAIQKLYKKMTIADMAELLGISYQALYWELLKCPKGNYTAEQAEDETKKRIQNGIDARRDAVKKCAKERSIVRAIITMNPDYSLEKIADTTNLPLDKVVMYANRRKKGGGQKSEE